MLKEKKIKDFHINIMKTEEPRTEGRSELGKKCRKIVADQGKNNEAMEREHGEIKRRKRKVRKQTKQTLTDRKEGVKNGGGEREGREEA